MEWLSPLLMAVQVISSLGVIVLVLLQQGKGADMGSAFGSGSAGSLFGAAGAANFLSRTTKWVAIIFFASTAGLAWLSHQPDRGVVDSGVMQGFEVPQVPGSTSGSNMAVPAVPAAPGNAPEAAAVPQAPASVPQGTEPAQAPGSGSVSGAAPEATPEASPSVSTPESGASAAPAPAAQASGNAQ